MAYQNVGTPKFYINMFDWLSSLGVISLTSDPEAFIYQHKLRTLPVKVEQIKSFNITGLDLFKLDFVAILGHRFGYQERMFRLATGGGNEANFISHTELVNLSMNGYTNYNGFSIIEFDSIEYNNYYFIFDSWGDAPFTEIGSIIAGSTYTMPHSPDLKLTMTREMDGVKRIRTKGGADLVNHKYYKPAMWGNAGAWELYSETPATPKLSRSGRRIWDLSFSYLQDSDVFPMLSSLNPYESVSDTGAVYSSATLGDDPTTDEVETDYVLTDETDWHDSNTLIDSNNFYSQVIHKTNGGQLPFIFQPDGANNNPDGFAICKFDMKEFKFSQVANGVYNVKLKIREVW